jgi:hypothetical protein
LLREAASGTDCSEKVFEVSGVIPRYTRPEIAAIWLPRTRFRMSFDFEA